MTALLNGPVVEPTLDTTAVARAARVNAARAALLASGRCVTIEQIADASGIKVDTVATRLRRLRRRGDAIAVDQAGQLYVPTFQLDDAFQFRNEVGGVVRRLRDAGLDEWAVWDWFEVTNPWIGRTVARAVDAGDWAAVERAVDGLLQ